MLKMIDALYKTWSLYLSPKAQLAGLCFVLGKLMSLPCFVLLFFNKTAALVFIVLYSALILSSFVIGVLAMIDEMRVLND